MAPFFRVAIGIAGLGVSILSGNISAFSAETSGDTRNTDGVYASELSALCAAMTERGCPIDRYLSHPRFRFHETIDASFQQSAEATGIKNLNDASADQDEDAKEAVFDRELDQYKEKVGFANRKEMAPRFIEKYRDQLVRCEQEYGISKEIITAVIGIESCYGHATGEYYAFNVYVSMYLRNYRQEFALTQLEELLKFVERTGTDMFSLQSSYGGAMGYMQFIPSSLNRWFVGTSLTDMDDAIASVANYLSYFLETEGSIERALFNYNRSVFYTRTILEIAEYAKLVEEAGRL